MRSAAQDAEKTPPRQPCVPLSPPRTASLSRPARCSSLALSPRQNTLARGSSGAPPPGSSNIVPAPELTLNLPAFDRLVRLVQASCDASAHFWAALRQLLVGAGTPLELPFSDASGDVPCTDALIAQAHEPSRELLQMSFDLVNPVEVAFLTGTPLHDVLHQLLLAVATEEATLRFGIVCETCGAVVAEGGHPRELREAAGATRCRVCTDPAQLASSHHLGVFFRFAPHIIHAPAATPRSPRCLALAQRRIARFFVPKDVPQSVLVATPRSYRYTLPTPLGPGKYTIFDPVSGAHATLHVEPVPPQPDAYELELLRLHRGRVRPAVATQPIHTIAVRLSELCGSDAPGVGEGEGRGGGATLRCHAGRITFSIHNDVGRSGWIALYEHLDLRTEAFVDDPPRHATLAELLLHPAFQHLEETLRSWGGATQRGARGATPAPGGLAATSIALKSAVFVAVGIDGIDAACGGGGDASALGLLAGVDNGLCEAATRHRCRVLTRGIAATALNDIRMVWAPRAAAALAFMCDVAVGASRGTPCPRLAHLVAHCGPAVAVVTDTAQHGGGGCCCFGRTVLQLRAILAALREGDDAGATAVAATAPAEGEATLILRATDAVLHPRDWSCEGNADDDAEGLARVMGLLEEHFGATKMVRTLHLRSHRAAAAEAARAPLSVELVELRLTPSTGTARGGGGGGGNDDDTDDSGNGDEGASAPPHGASMAVKLAALHPAVYTPDAASALSAGLFDGLPREEWPSPVSSL